MKVLSPAKINLLLRILGQREDGYHILQTYFQLLNWGDDMEFSLTSNNTVNVNGDFNNLPVEKNLIFKAAQLLLPFKTIDEGIHISVNKQIPQGSGLGGGSSNAGTTLRVLNKLWKCHLSDSELMEMAISLGADVPVFVFNQSAIAHGIGEELIKHEIEKYYFVLIFPPVSISTMEVFSDALLDRHQKEIPAHKISNRKYWNNACLPVVLRKFPQVSEIYNFSNNLAPTCMSGTGSTLFTSFNSQADAIAFTRQCPGDWKTVICQSRQK